LPALAFWIVVMEKMQIATTNIEIRSFSLFICSQDRLGTTAYDFSICFTFNILQSFRHVKYALRHPIS